MRTIKTLFPISLLLVGLGLNASLLFGKPEYTKKEKKGCVTCHTKANQKDLNDVGKCYGEKKSLETCKAK